MTKNLITLVNEGLKVIGEPEITSFTSTNILQERLIEAVNEAVQDITDLADFDWGNKHTTITTTAKVTSGRVSCTSGSNTVTSVDTNGAAADNFANITAGMWIRIGTDTQSYLVSSVSTGGSPDTLTLKVAYRGSWASKASYVAFQDTYAITDTDYDRPKNLVYSEPQAAILGLTGKIRQNELNLVDFATIISRCGGDLHANTSGIPAFAAQTAPNSSYQSQIILWPYPDHAKIVDVWYTAKYTVVSASASVPFASTAPDAAYNAVSARVRAEACLWDKQVEEAQYWLKAYDACKMTLVRRKNRDAVDRGFDVACYRSSYAGRYPVRSGIAFDRKGAQR